MIVVTGMHRSGTSCVTGLLEKCGFSLGTSHPLLNEPRFDNQKGHFENRSVISINDAILTESGGNWFKVPSKENIEKTSERFSGHIQNFGRTFNGNIVKDPRLCLTINTWLKNCPLEAAVLCLRHPIAVAGSLKRRDGIPVEYSLDLWYQYNIRFFLDCRSIPVYIVNYDNLGSNTVFELSNLLERLGIQLDIPDILARTGDFYTNELNHAGRQECFNDLLPSHVRMLYEKLLEHTFTRKNCIEPEKVAA